ncbi:TIGR04295 family B12-binding domain-containing radical SAM protein [Rhizosaccharibacter radicis]|uniref:TIGR04295 family B12-binding domain-containing radical SAM protein n=1 Tax=Rhizosaccharibacter radicis TaxID=2782605 RepID=A0ABT1VZD0_9PROT|nr:TIGR04295 family B12-binding domain-containing radical SAM protein [Acetobacteraceae bacterium KSS12]
MRLALLNPPWSFEGSIYFGCREPHLPLELGACRALLEAAGHDTLMLDGALDDLGIEAMADRVAAWAPDIAVITTAPTYLFWRCAQPELRIPRLLIDALRARSPGTRLVAVGPHGSATPEPALRKSGADALIRGECEEAVLALANGAEPGMLPGTAVLRHDALLAPGAPLATRFTDLPALRWPAHWIARHRHHHHRYDQPHDNSGHDLPGAEVEASRGCPYTCSFCAKIDFRDKYRRRDLAPLLAEIDALRAQGAGYLYFIDEIFLPNRELLEALVGRGLRFGVQTRIDLWKPDMIELLGRAGCVSIEAGIESLTVEGRAALDKRCKLDTDQLADLLILAKQHVPFVQANLIETASDDPALVTAWREKLLAAGVWANDPVPLYPYPSSPDYRKLWGMPDDQAWERAHAHYLSLFADMSDIQDAAPKPLPELEAVCGCS